MIPGSNTLSYTYETSNNTWKFHGIYRCVWGIEPRPEVSAKCRCHRGNFRPERIVPTARTCRPAEVACNPIN